VILADRRLLWMLGAGLAIRCGFAFWLDGSMVLVGDEGVYARYASWLLRSGELHSDALVRPPLYFLFLALAKFVAGPERWILFAKLLQCLASTATAIPIYRSARRLAGERAARIAAAFLLFGPTSIAYSHLLWPETVFTLIAAIVFDAIASLERGSLVRAAGVGALTGIAMLMKPVIGLLCVVLAASWLLRLGAARAAQLSLAFGLATALVLAPWVARNLLLYGPTVLVENEGPYNLWVANAPEPPEEIWEQWQALPDPVTRSRVGSERGMAAIREDPARFVRNLGVRLVNLWGFEWFATRHFAIGGYRDVSRGAFLGWFWTLQTAWVLALLAAALGFSALWRDPGLRVVLIYTLLFSAVSMVLVSTTRWRLPFEFWICVSAGIGVERALAGTLVRRDLALAGVAIAVLFVSATRPLFRTIASGEFDTPRDLARSEWTFFRY